jgi:GTP-binding protein
MNKNTSPDEGKKINRKIHLYNARFVCSAGQYSEMPKAVHNEYCLLGRSNVGKSSFINHVLENHSLAKVSKEPGKTRTANFYEVTGSMIWVDMPGYGYAKTPRNQKGRMSDLINDYCSRRETCKGIIWLVDIRHPGAQADVEILAWLRELGIPLFPVLTKSDKLSYGKGLEEIRRMVTVFRLPFPPITYSILENSSRARFWKAFIDWTKAIE